MISFGVIVVIGVVSVSAENCQLKFADFPAKEPIFLSKGLLLITPKDDSIRLNADEEIFLACPGTNNKFDNLLVNENPVKATCIKDSSLKVGSKEEKKSLSSLSCKNPARGETERTFITCGQTGKIIHIGHQIGGKLSTLFDICYNDAKESPLYADHTIYGSAISNSAKPEGRPSFKVGGLASLKNPKQYYEISAQKQTFAALLGSVSSKYFPSQASFLAKGHLAPDRDQVFLSSQQSTYFYINVVPQWQQINNGNWKILENALRNLANATKENFRVFTGAHQILALENSAGKLTEINLAGNLLPVPKFIWKIFYSMLTRKAIAFISLNNPFINTATNEHFLCQNICDAQGWITPSWKDPTKGLIYCCAVDELRKSVPNVPPLNITGIQSRF